MSSINKLELSNTEIIEDVDGGTEIKKISRRHWSPGEFKRLMRFVFKHAKENRTIKLLDGKQRMIKIRDDKRHRWTTIGHMGIFAFNTGLRFSEIRGLKWKDVQIDEPPYAAFIERRKKKVEGRKLEKILLNIGATSVLNERRDWIEHNGIRTSKKGRAKVYGARSSIYVFSTFEGGKPYTDKFLTHGLKEAFAAAKSEGIHFRAPDISAHDMRRAYTSWTRKKGYSIESIQSDLGHVKIETTRRYVIETSLLEEQLKKTQEDPLSMGGY